MRLVIDANILFSLLIKEGKTSELLSNLFLQLYAPEFIFEEIEKHKEEILNKTKRSENEFSHVFELIKEIVKIIQYNEFASSLKDAEKISPDVNDAAYFALALKLNCPIWSNDKKLKEQNKIKVYSTEDLINLLKQSK